MRRSLLVLAIVLGASGLNQAHAQLDSQFGVINDPFLLYYGFFLPRQAALANQPGPGATLNYVAAERQQYAVTNRASLYDPSSPYGAPNYEMGAVGEARSPERKVLSRTPGIYTSHINGNGPAGYYNRAQSYYPTMRTGRGANANVAAIRPQGGGRFSNVGRPQPTAGMGGWR